MNAIIVDFRAFDTLGEVTVLAVAAIGAASLILAAHRQRRRPSDVVENTDAAAEESVPERTDDESRPKEGAPS